MGESVQVSVFLSTVPSTPLIRVLIEDDIHPEVQSCRDSVFTPTCTSHPTKIHPLQVSYTPGGSQRWTRLVEEGFTPKLSMHFVDYDSAMCFYVVYAISCGFEPRLHTTKCTRSVELLRKSIVCNRQGFRDNKRKLKCPAQEVDTDSTVKTQGSRNVKVTRVGCPAMMRVEAVEGGGYRVDQFVAVHNHRLLSVIDKEFHKVVRHLSGFQKKRNYSIFGDALSYDATYGTNKYRMKFTPFTGVDHHKRSVTFACALLDHEDEHYFAWCFKKILDCMDQKEPLCLVTDQDPGMLLAIPKVFKTTRHHFCMWHIMEKVSAKVGAITCKETDFLSRLNSVVWDSSLEPVEFEQRWLEVMKDFDLGGHKWLSSMFRDKHLWIPAFFRDMPMGGLLRTTQRSESANSFFKRYQNHYGTLVEFWLRYETAIEQQRYLQKCLDKDSEHSLPVTTPSPTKFELHAASVYTHKVFYDVQVELKHTSICGLAGMPLNGDIRVYDVNDELRHTTFQVFYTATTEDVKCTCKLFESKGLLCDMFLGFVANLQKHSRKIHCPSLVQGFL
ncbi:protein FAR1-RELATED SEQUENCE 5-like [Silene latifolia]|uniref:protein FAR1-RELATED SEQUENCE 5-like n=1 Tax=Silene latifolia TaxID=37657 RepID=UPI003D775477